MHARRLSSNPDPTLQKYLARIQTKLQQAGAGVGSTTQTNASALGTTS